MIQYISHFNLQAKHDFKDAKDDLGSDKKDNYRYYFNLGECNSGLASVKKKENNEEESIKYYEEAIKFYNQALNYSTPQEIRHIYGKIGDCYYDIVYILIILYEMQKEYKKSIPYLENSIKNETPQKEKAEIYKKLGECYSKIVYIYIYIQSCLIV